MASETKPEKALEKSMKDLKIGVTSKEVDSNMFRAKDGSTSDAVSCISSGDATSSIKESEVDQEALMAEQSMYYPMNGVYGYYYPGFDGPLGDWEDNGYFVGTDGSEIQHSATQSDNGSLVYYFNGFPAGYSPYSAVSPGAVVGVDGQYLTQQLYYPCPIYQPLVSPGFFSQTVTYGPELVPAYVWDSPQIYSVGLHGNGYGRDPTAPSTKPNYPSHNHVIAPSKAATPSRPSTFGKKGAATIVDASQSAAMHNQALKAETKVNNELSKGFHPANKLHSYSSPAKSSLLYPSITGNVKTAGRTWVGTDKQKEANQPQGATGFDMLNEQNRGPRTNGCQGTWVSVYDSTAGSDANISNGILEASIKKEDFNLPDFPTKYDHAFFFVIKSYSEDDIHKSIKYNVWASTPNGNKRLDNAFQVAQDKAAEKGSKCPIFLFFSVNASGQFCGVAEMIGQVNFNKNMDFWQQDKWNGYFPVKWHIIKDIPNPQFRHITLENNDNKPVTNSRDTQEVKFPQGTEMLNIFKNYSAKTSILDDFGFYESRQKAMLDKRIKLTINELDHLKLKTEATIKFAKPAEGQAIAASPQLLEACARAKDELRAGSVAVVKE